MKFKRRFDRFAVAVILTAALLSVSFFGATPTIVLAEGGGSDPYSEDSNVGVACGSENSAIGSEDFGTLAVVLLMIQVVL